MSACRANTAAAGRQTTGADMSLCKAAEVPCHSKVL